MVRDRLSVDSAIRCNVGFLASEVKAHAKGGAFVGRFLGMYPIESAIIN
jgi:Na+/citrate or Na+/malate symporter